MVQFLFFVSVGIGSRKFELFDCLKREILEDKVFPVGEETVIHNDNDEDDIVNTDALFIISFENQENS